MKNFIRMWQNEYLLCLRNTKPRSNLLRQLVIGDVLLIQEGAAGSSWKLACIVRLSKGRDGQVRSALVKLGQTQNVVRQPIVLLHPWELSDQVDCWVNIWIQIETESCMYVQVSFRWGRTVQSKWDDIVAGPTPLFQEGSVENSTLPWEKERLTMTKHRTLQVSHGT